MSELRIMDGVVHICTRPSMYVKHSTVAEIVAWLDYDASGHKKCGVRCAPMNWPAFRQECLSKVDLLAMQPNDLIEMWRNNELCLQ